MHARTPRGAGGGSCLVLDFPDAQAASGPALVASYSWELSLVRAQIFEDKNGVSFPSVASPS